jgi:peptidoglycan biosynthesis protein MviN/MurJ (putative lipid II flippase)
LVDVFLGLVVVLRAYIVRIILGSGAFGWNATRLTAALLALFTIGLVAQGLVLLFSRALYAIKQSWRPFLYQLGAAIFTAIIALIFLGMSGPGSRFLLILDALLRVSGASGTPVLVLALSATLGEIFLATWATIALKQAAPTLAKELTRPPLRWHYRSNCRRGSGIRCTHLTWRHCSLNDDIGRVS